MRAAFMVGLLLPVSLLPAPRVDVARVQTPDGLRMIVPGDGVSTCAEEVTLVAFVPDDLAGDVRVSYAGSVAKPRTERGYAHLRVPLALGPNVIRLTAAGDDGRSAAVEATVFRKPRFGRGISTELPSYRFHAPLTERECAGCHEMKQERRDTTASATPDPACWKCHSDKAFQKNSHIPLSEGGCFDCHERESQPAYSVKSGPEGLCAECHEAHGQGDYAFVHGPVSSGSCDVCHDPHGSPYEKQTRLPVSDLCVMCHEHLGKLLAEKGAHLPFRKGDCLRCHSPHWSSQISGLVEDPRTLCERCHKVATGVPAHIHQSNVKPDSRMGRELPWLIDGRLTCISCHNPHASKVDGLLRTSPEQGCNGCHVK